MHPPPNLALQSSSTSAITQPAVYEYIFVPQTPSDYYLFWNLKSDHCGGRYLRWWDVFVDALNRFHLMRCDVINYDDAISAADS